VAGLLFAEPVLPLIVDLMLLVVEWEPIVSHVDVFFVALCQCFFNILNKQKKMFVSATHPWLKETFIAILDDDGNPHKTKSLNNVKSKSHAMALWKCEKTNCIKNCTHIYKARIRHKARDLPTECPFCCGRQVCLCNSIASHAKLFSEWHPTLNTNVDPQKVSLHSHTAVYWKCQTSTCDHHVWKVSPNQRTSHMSNCPFCAHQKCCACYCLMTQYATLVNEEWDKEKNRNLNVWELAPTSRKKAWWICKRCSHSWQAAISNRTVNESGCPHCRQSKMEKKMALILQKLIVDGVITSFQSQWPIPHTKMEADFLVSLPEENIIIEMDGQQHFFAVGFGSKSKTKEQKFIEVQRNDQRKNNWCLEHHMRILRIGYNVDEHEYYSIVQSFAKNTSTQFMLISNKE